MAMKKEGGRSFERLAMESHRHLLLLQELAVGQTLQVTAPTRNLGRGRALGSDNAP